MQIYKNAMRVCVGIFFYLLLSYAIFVGLQIDVHRGSVLVVLSLTLLAIYLYFVRTKKGR